MSEYFRLDYCVILKGAIKQIMQHSLEQRQNLPNIFLSKKYALVI